MNAILRAVGYRENEHMVNFTKCWSMKCPHPGADVEVLQAALRIAGFEAEVDPKDHSTTEAVDMIANGTADITVHSIIQKVERMARVDFTLPINYFVYGYLTKEVDDVQVEDFIMTSVSPWLYPFIYGSAIVYAILMVFMSRAKVKYIFENLNGVLNAVERHGWNIIVDNGGYDPTMFCREEYKECRTRIEKLRPQLLFIREPAMPQQMLAFAISKKIPHVRRLLNKALAAMQSSYGTFAARYRLPLRLYNRSDSRNEFYVLSFLYIWPLFRVMFLCLTISLTVLILENIYARLTLIREIFQCLFTRIHCCRIRIVHRE
ncbi:unnamed protein product, partial [Mesorhabditis belari]|uniref:Solute-binding protein family 3/N-terminal domain-containing protein n=1 Tax=Mesorhabditis belari TaxID=2138241 RepID=A0AAF3FGN3_9BILA